MSEREDLALAPAETVLESTQKVNELHKFNNNRWTGKNRGEFRG